VVPFRAMVEHVFPADFVEPDIPFTAKIDAAVGVAWLLAAIDPSAGIVAAFPECPIRSRVMGRGFGVGGAIGFGHLSVFPAGW